MTEPSSAGQHVEVPDHWFEPVERCWCGGRSNDASAFSSEYRSCQRCGTHFASKRLKQEYVASFYSYDGYWHRRQSDKSHPTLWDRQELLERDGRVDRWMEAIHRHLPLGKLGTAVEAGCAEATLLQRLRRDGWTTVGIEPDANTAAAVRERTGLDIRAGAFPDTPAPRCDLFIACDVLEHVTDPRRFLYAAREALVSDGLLFLQLPLIGGEDEGFGSITEKVFDWQEHAFIYTRESIRLLLESCEYSVVENDSGWVRAHEFVVARRWNRPARSRRHLANLPEMFSDEWTTFIDTLNDFAAPLGLRQFNNWSKLWEYPSVWRQGLSETRWQGCRVLDLGSEQSPFPWWLATQGAAVTLVERSANWVDQWTAVRDALGRPSVDWRIVDSSRLPFDDDTFDVVTSFSVIEHQDDKALAASEVARVLKPGGLFGISFDICEPELGMTFPEWNGRALTRREFERLFWNNTRFRTDDAIDWNMEDVPAFLNWHKRTAAHHNYVTGAAVLAKRRAGFWARMRKALTL